MIKSTLNEDISVIGYMTEREKGTNIITKGDSTYPITAQGWNAFKRTRVKVFSGYEDTGTTRFIDNYCDRLQQF